MIKGETKEQIRGLLKDGYTYAEIERRTGVCSHTVAKILKQMQREKQTPADLLESLISYPIPDDAIPGRCPSCGSNCFLPCKACLMKQYNKLLEDS